jgi:hypothetical protein
MQADSTHLVQREMPYYVQEQSLKHVISPTIEKIMQLNPELLLGSSSLFNYDPASHTIRLSSSFQNLLKLLVSFNEVDAKALTASSLYDLNSILQQAQGVRGGFMRKEGTERYHLADNSLLQSNRPTLDALFQQLGFVLPQSIEYEMTVDHCILFGGLVERMENRIIEALRYLNKNLKVTGHIFLLGSNRLLTQSEIDDYLKPKLEKLDESQRIYWDEVFKDSKQATEANAFVFLWKCLVPQDMQILFADKLIGIKSTRIGSSYREQEGHRVTTEVTIEDWMPFYKADEPQTIFAIAEQPFIRLADQLRSGLLSNAKKATRNELIERINQTVFYFVFPSPRSNPLISVRLDEIGRHVYRIVDTLKYLESL